jgi:Undecaprenyl-phosphate galactose phosphotransferase WbaP
VTLATIGKAMAIKIQDAPRRVAKRATIQGYRWIASFWLIMSDLVSNLFAVAVIYGVWSTVKGDMPLALYVRLLPILLILPIAYYLDGLYPGIGISPVEELRRLTVATSFAYLIIGALSFFLRNAAQYSRFTFVISYLLALLVVPLFRVCLRIILIRLGWWGEPVVLIGFGEQGNDIYKHLISNPEFGLKPVLMLNGIDAEANHPSGLSVLSLSYVLDDGLPQEWKGIQTALLVTAEISPNLMNELIMAKKLPFRQLVMVSEKWLWGTVSVTPYDMRGILGLEIRQNLLDPGHQFSKRLLDLSIILLSSPLWMPLMLLCAVCIYIDSPGPVFYSHERYGQYGKKIKVWKLRTMVLNADQILEERLKRQTDAQQEWEGYQKLKSDDRITRVGRVLRRLSLDELPQFWNVLWGDMSLVGPRPIVDNEIVRYGERINLIRQVKPGLSGLWQVSGRNDVGYDERVVMDEYYVRNWSVWFDLYILARTFVAVLSGRGAY